MRYLIVGGTSIFGEGLVDSLLGNPETEEIVATKLIDEKEYQRERLKWVNLDIRNVDDTTQVVKNANADTIFHLATQDSVGYAWESPTETVDVNVVGTINLLNSIRDISPKARLIIAGSGEEYGRMSFSELPAKETALPHPNNIYGATKACQTMFAKLYNQAFGMDIVVLRTFYETSIQQDDKFAVSSFCKQFAEIEAGKKLPLIFTGNLSNIRDFTDVDDLIRALVLVAQKGRSGEIYNAARGKETSLMDIIKILEDLTGIQVKIHRDSSRVRPMDSPSTVADVSKIREDTGWIAEIPLTLTVEKMLNYWRNVK